jgi:heptosyltransferase-2
VGRRVLIVPKGYIGDIVLTSPVFEALKRSAPDVHVTALVPPQFADFVRRDIYVDEVLPFDRRSEFSGWSGLKAFAEHLRAQRFDVAYSFQRSPRTAMLLWYAAIETRVGPADSLLSFLLTRRVTSTKRNHEVVRNLEIVQEDLTAEVQEGLRALSRSGPVPVSDSFSLRVPQVSLDEISAPLAGYLSVQRPFVVLSPGSVWATKRWRPQGFREVAAALVSRGFRVVVVGAPDDSGACAEVCRDQQMHEGALTNMCGQTSLLELIYLIQQSRAVICNDSLALHLASALKIPNVAIFCATSPLFGFGPWKNRAVVVERSDLFCKPCRRHGSKRCPTGTQACMNGVTAGDVLKAFDDLVCDDSKRRIPSGSLRVL